MAILRVATLPQTGQIADHLSPEKEVVARGGQAAILRAATLPQIGQITEAILRDLLGPECTTATSSTIQVADGNLFIEELLRKK